MTLARDFESDEGGITESLTKRCEPMFRREAVVPVIASSGRCDRFSLDVARLPKPLTTSKKESTLPALISSRLARFFL